MAGLSFGTDDEALIQPLVEPDDSSQSVIAAELRRLPARQRRLLYLHYDQGKTLSAAAKELGFGCSWASRMHSRTLAMLRAATKDASPPHRLSRLGRDEKHPGDSVPTDLRVPSKRSGSS